MLILFTVPLFFLRYFIYLYFILSIEIFLYSFARLPQLTAAIELVNEISKQLTERKNDAVTEISNTFDELEKALHQRKTALITEVENICSTKQKVRGLFDFFLLMVRELKFTVMFHILVQAPLTVCLCLYGHS